MQAAPEDARAFIQKYFDAWKGTGGALIVAYYSDDVLLQLPTGKRAGKVRGARQFVRPFIAGFPGKHRRRSEFNARAQPRCRRTELRSDITAGSFANIAPTDKKLQVPAAPSTNTIWPSALFAPGRLYIQLCPCNESKPKRPCRRMVAANRAPR
jgi:hypothetical protein